MDWVNLTGRLSENLKKYRYAIIILLIGLVLMLLPTGEKEAPAEAVAPQEKTELTVESQLEALLEQLKGAGKVKVMLTVSTGSETVYQTDENHNDNTDSSSYRWETVIVSTDANGEEGLIKQVNPPQYLGAVILCQGGDNPTVRLAIVDAVSKLTGLGADKICVLKMK